MRYADLHTHSFYSDGSMSPSDIPRKASEQDVGAVSINDHDTTEGAEEFIDACKTHDVEGIISLEFSAFEGDLSIHLLPYFFEGNGKFQDKEVQDLLQQVRKAQIERRNLQVNRINRFYDTGFFPDAERQLDFEEIVENNPYRQLTWKPISDMMVFLHYAPDEKHARAILDSTCYVHFIDQELQHTLVQKYGGGFIDAKKAVRFFARRADMVVLAHPLSRKVRWDRRYVWHFIGELKNNGLRGVECLTHKHSPENIEFLLARSLEDGMLITGGSDAEYEDKVGIIHRDPKSPYHRYHMSDFKRLKKQVYENRFSD